MDTITIATEGRDHKLGDMTLAHRSRRINRFPIESEHFLDQRIRTGLNGFDQGGWRARAP
jgi:hypothetical protein